MKELYLTFIGKIKSLAYANVSRANIRELLDAYYLLIDKLRAMDEAYRPGYVFQQVEVPSVSVFMIDLRKFLQEIQNE